MDLALKKYSKTIDRSHEMAQAPQPLSLYELTESIKKALALSMPRTVWIKAEILEFNRHYSSGHCYLELIEKDKKSDKIIARSRATIWSYSARMLEPYFKSMTGRPLQEGMKVMVNVSVEFSEIYGLSLNIKDIDPAYTIGDMELQKQAVIQKLKEDGVFDMNKSLDFPLVPQRIAVVSSETAAGWGDFKQQLINNPFRFRFHCTLFPALMQGNGTEQSVVDALDRIDENNEFDLVVIIRGGGSKADLGAFDNYRIANYISQFPIPILTGIGHERDESVADLVAYQALKTPTAVAEFLISAVEAFAHEIDTAEEQLKHFASSYFQEQKDRIEQLSIRVHRSIQERIKSENKLLEFLEAKAKTAFKHRLQDEKTRLEHYSALTQTKLSQKLKVAELSLSSYEIRLKQAVKNALRNKKAELDQAEIHLKLLDPRNLAKRGYALMVQKGRIIKEIDDIDPSLPLSSLMDKGEIISSILEIKKKTPVCTPNIE